MASYLKRPLHPLPISSSVQVPLLHGHVAPTSRLDHQHVEGYARWHSRTVQIVDHPFIASDIVNTDRVRVENESAAGTQVRSDNQNRIGITIGEWVINGG